MFRSEADPTGENLDALSAELERQADIYRGLGVKKDKIMRLIVPRPDRLPKELTIPVVTLGTSVPLKRQASFAGIYAYYKLSRGHDIAGGITFTKPNLIWMQDGTKYKNKSVYWVRQNVERNERPATQADGIVLAIVHPDILKVIRDDHYIDLPGTCVRSHEVPYLADGSFGRRLALDFDDVIDASEMPNWGSASSGN